MKLSFNLKFFPALKATVETNAELRKRNEQRLQKLKQSNTLVELKQTTNR